MLCSRVAVMFVATMLVSSVAGRDAVWVGSATAQVSESPSAAPGLGRPKVHRVAGDVYAVTDLYHSAGGKSGVNAGIIFTKGNVVFIDAGMSIASGEYLWNLAREKMKGNEKIFLILTHHHSDHVFGMRVFKDRGATVLTHPAVADSLRGDKGQYKAFIAKASGWTERQADEILGEVILSVPDRLLEQDVTLDIRGRPIRILVTPGHVPDALCVYDASSKTLFAGDTVYEGTRLNTKFGGPPEWRTWISHLERLKNLKITTLCPGHGDLCKRDEIDRNISFLKSLLSPKPKA